MPAFATGDATPTSKGYVDAQMASLQDNLPGAAANTVVTTTATAGETGTKAIYNASGNYMEQQNALVTAEDANTAIQMAIQGELVCREYDPTGQYCYVYDVRPATAKSASKNLLDPSFMDNSTYGPITVNGRSFRAARVLPTEPGKTYTLSANLTYTNYYYYYLGIISPEGDLNYRSSGHPCPWMWNNNSTGGAGSKRGTCTFTTDNNSEYKYVVYFPGQTNDIQVSKKSLTLSEYQMEEGSTATSYVPYQNLYMPSGN